MIKKLKVLTHRHQMKFHQKHMITQPQENNKKPITLHHQTTGNMQNSIPQKTHMDIQVIVNNHKTHHQFPHKKSTNFNHKITTWKTEASLQLATWIPQGDDTKDTWNAKFIAPREKFVYNKFYTRKNQKSDVNMLSKSKKTNIYQIIMKIEKQIYIF